MTKFLSVLNKNSSNMPRLSIKTRREIERLSASLPAMSARLERESRIICGTAWIGKKVGWCDVCGEEFEHQLWDSRKKEIRCPKCGAKVALKKSPQKKVSNNTYYFQEVTVAGEWQVVRTWFCRRESMRRIMYGSKEMLPMSVKYEAREVYQRFIRKATVPIIIGLGVQGASFYCDLWKWDSKWKIRREDSQHYIGAWMATRPKLLPELKMRGLTRLSDNCSASKQIEKVFNEWEAEVLLKAGAKEMYDYFITSPRTMMDYWPSVRVALRHHYHVKDVSMWLDLLGMLNSEGKDMRNPHYVCPADLKAEHDRWMEIRRRRWEKQIAEEEERERRRQAELLDEDGQSNADYRDRLGKMLGVIVTVGDIELRPLQSIKEFYDEGEAMHHCVFTNKYYSKDGCLIIGVRVNGERAETIEINTKEWRIMQCRGKHNQDSQYHEAIMEAMTNNINKYRRMAL